MRMRGALAWLVAAGTLVAACGYASDPIIDTWPIGAAVACGDAAYCDAEVRVGLAELDVRDPGHAAVTSTEFHLVGTCTDPDTGNRLLFNTGGFSPSVLVVHLADGSTHAIGVGGHGIDPGPFGTDWLLTSGCRVPSS